MNQKIQLKSITRKSHVRKTKCSTKNRVGFVKKSDIYATMYEEVNLTYKHIFATNSYILLQIHNNNKQWVNLI